MGTMIPAITIFILCLACIWTVDASHEIAATKYGCVLPKEPWYGTFVFNDRKRSLRYKCDEGYMLTGSYLVKDRKCRAGGTWTGKDRDCMRLYALKSKCSKLRSPNNGMVSVEGRDIGHSAHYHCDPGFVLEGSPIVTCQRGRKWSGTLPICSSRRTTEDFANHLKDKMIDSLAAATTGSQSVAQSRLSPGKSGLDIVLLVDVSSSIGDKSLVSAKKFMKLIVDLFGVSDQPSGGKGGSRFALVTFSSEAQIVFNLDDITARSKEAVKASIDGIQKLGGGTNFRKALSKILAKVYLPKILNDPVRHQGATRAIFLLTDAEENNDLKSNSLERIEAQANALKRGALFEIFAIGVGQNIDNFVLSQIASKPEIEHVFLIDQFKDLDKIGDIIAEKNIDYGRCGISGKTEIAQGSQDAAKGAWPWLGWLSIITDDTLPRSCGGALLCDRWFLTTASCVSKVTGNQVVVFNASQINLYLSDHWVYRKDSEEVWPVVKDVLIHDNYTGQMIADLGIRDYDVALLDLGENDTLRPVLNKYLRPLCYPSDTGSLVTADYMLKAMMSFLEDKSGYTAGWGHAPDSAEYIGILYTNMKQNKRPVQKTKACRGRYPDLDNDRYYCVGSPFVESESCQGDIGGPYMVQMPNKRYMSMGLALNTRGCTEKYRFSIMLNLLHSSIVQWIQPILNGCNRLEEMTDSEPDEDPIDGDPDADPIDGDPDADPIDGDPDADPIDGEPDEDPADDEHASP